MERSSPARVAGKLCRQVTLAGETYTLSQPLKLSGYADSEALILSRRLDPVETGLRACARLPANRHAAVWEGVAAAASRGIAADEEWAAFDRSLWRPAFRFWQALDPKHKQDKTMLEGVAWAVELLHAISVAEFEAAMSAVATVAEDAAIKKLVWPERKRSGPAPSDGAPVFGGWPAVYKRFAECYGFNDRTVNELPLYLACMLMGAIGPDHENVEMTYDDYQRYYA